MKKKQIIGIIIAVAVVAAMIFAYGAFGEKPTQGSKAITIEIIDSKEASVVYELNTDAQYLIEAMEEAKADGLTYSGTEDQYSLMINEVNGESAVYETDGAYWGFYLNGEYCNYGVSEQPVNDGDAFRIIYTVA